MVDIADVYVDLTVDGSDARRQARTAAHEAGAEAEKEFSASGTRSGAKFATQFRRAITGQIGNDFRKTVNTSLGRDSEAALAQAGERLGKKFTARFNQASAVGFNLLGASWANNTSSLEGRVRVTGERLGRGLGAGFTSGFTQYLKGGTLKSALVSASAAGALSIASDHLGGSLGSRAGLGFLRAFRLSAAGGKFDLKTFLKEGFKEAAIFAFGSKLGGVFVSGFGTGLRVLKRVAGNAFLQLTLLAGSLGSMAVVLAAGFSSAFGAALKVGLARALDVGGLLAALGLGAATAVIAIKGLSSAMKAQAQVNKDLAATGKTTVAHLGELNAQMKALPPNARAVVASVVALEKPLKGIKASVQNAFFSGLAGPLKGLGTTLLPVLNHGLTQTAAVLGNAAAQGLRFLSSAEGLRLVRGILNGLNQVLPGLLSGLGGFAHGLLTLFNAILHPLSGIQSTTVRMSDSFARLGNAFSAWTSKIAGDGSLEAFMTRTNSGFKTAWELLKDLGGIIKNVFVAAAPAGNSVIASLGGALKTFRDWTASASGKNAIATWARGVADNISKVGDIIKNLMPWLQRLLDPKFLNAVLRIADTVTYFTQPIIAGFSLMTFHLTHFADAVVGVGDMVRNFGDFFVGLFTLDFPKAIKSFEGFFTGAFSTFTGLATIWVTSFGALLGVGWVRAFARALPAAFGILKTQGLAALLSRDGAKAIAAASFAGVKSGLAFRLGLVAGLAGLLIVWNQIKDKLGDKAIYIEIAAGVAIVTAAVFRLRAAIASAQTGMASMAVSGGLAGAAAGFREGRAAGGLLSGFKGGIGGLFGAGGARGLENEAATATSAFGRVAGGLKSVFSASNLAKGGAIGLGASLVNTVLPAHKSNSAMGVLSSTLTGASIGSIGGPWGAAAGAAVGLAKGLWSVFKGGGPAKSAIDKLKESVDATLPSITSLADQLKGLNPEGPNASDVLAANLLKSLTDTSELKTAASGAGLKPVDIVNQIMGGDSSKALAQIQAVIDKTEALRKAVALQIVAYANDPKKTDLGLAAKNRYQELAKQIEQQKYLAQWIKTGAERTFAARNLAIQKTREANRAAFQYLQTTVAYKNAIAGLPAKAVTAIQASGVRPTLASVVELGYKYHLLPSRVQTLLQALGYESTRDKIIKAYAGLSKFDGSKGTAYLDVNTQGVIRSLKALGDQFAKSKSPWLSTLGGFAQGFANVAAATAGPAAAKTLQDNLVIDAFNDTPSGGGGYTPVSAPTSGGGSAASAKKAAKLYAKTLNQALFGGGTTKIFNEKTGKLVVAWGKQLVTSLSGVQNRLSTLRRQLVNYGATSAVAVLDKMSPHAVALAKSLETVNKKLADAKQKLDTVKQQFADMKKSVSDAFNQSVFTAQNANFSSIKNSLTDQIRNTTAFITVVERLRKLGLNKKSLGDIIAGGPAALASAQGLLQSGAFGVGQVNAMQSQLDALSNQAGTSAANIMYGAGVQTAQGVVDGLKAQQTNIQNRLIAWGKTIGESVAKALNRQTGKGPTKRAMGGWASGVTLVGENGPELLELPTGSYVRDAARTRAMVQGSAPRSSEPNVTIHQNYYGPSTGSERLRELDWTLRYATKARQATAPGLAS